MENQQDFDKQTLTEHLSQLDSLSIDELLEQRYSRLMSYGQFTSQ